MAEASADRAASKSIKLLVVSSPDSPELSVLKSLPPAVQVVGIGRTLADFGRLDQSEWDSVEVLLNCGVGKNAGKREDIQALWPKLRNLRWMHSSSAGLEHLLFPDLVNGGVPVTNAKGVYSHSLAEYVLAGCNWFAKDLPRLRRQQAAANWEPYDVEELRGRTMGIVGFGDIGQACGRLAKAFKMKIIGLRQRPLTEEEISQGIADEVLPPQRLLELVSASDYIVMATPYTPATDKLFGSAAIAAMKRTAVFINVGRGKCVDEPALIDALQAGKIRGAVLDVFATEPLPPDSPLWRLDNVLMSPHCADRTSDFQLESLQFFVSNMTRFVEGQPLLNVCDLQRGY